MKDGEITVRVDGADEVAEALERFPSELVAHAFPGALRRGGEVLMEAVRVRTPSDPDATSVKEYGYDLKSAIDVKVDLYADGGIAKVHFGDKSYIASFCEFGHWQLSTGPDDEARKVLGVVAPHPFMRPAASAVADAVVETFAHALLDGINSGGGSFAGYLQEED